jgi:hypothetical protein
MPSPSEGQTDELDIPNQVTYIENRTACLNTVGCGSAEPKGYLVGWPAEYNTFGK